MKACLNSGSGSSLPVAALPQEHTCMQCTPLTVNCFFSTSPDCLCPRCNLSGSSVTGGGGWLLQKKVVMPVWILCIWADLTVERGWERSEVLKSSTETSYYDVIARALHSVDKRGTHREAIWQLEGASWQRAATIRTDTAEKGAPRNVQSSPGGGTTTRKCCQLRHCSVKQSKKLSHK